MSDKSQISSAEISRRSLLQGAASVAGAATAVGVTARSAKAAKVLKQRGVVMKGYVQDIEAIAVKNDEFRRVLYTAKHSQLVVMALKPKEEIGAEVHSSTSSFASKREPARRFSMAFEPRSKRASPYSSRPGPITTSSIPAMFH